MDTNPMQLLDELVYQSPPVQKIEEVELQKNGVELQVLRLDLIHPVISGNKAYKLYFHLKEAMNSGASAIITWGGAWSNHLVATAAAASFVKLKSVGIVRGEEWKSKKLTPTLNTCRNLGMQLHFVDRMQYREKEMDAYLEQVRLQFENACFIPQGGYHELGVRGAALIAEHIDPSVTHIVVPIGTGTTFAGLASQLLPHQTLIGVPVLKNAFYLQEELVPYYKSAQKTDWWFDAHEGGFGKINAALIDAMNKVYQQFNLPLDVVYTGKVFKMLMQKIAQQYFNPGDKILFIHTGGLQGNESSKEQLIY